MRLQSSLQAKISRTKKKLSEPISLMPGVIALVGVAACLTGLMAVVMAPGTYSVVNTEFPVVSAAIEDLSLHRYAERPEHFIKATTPAVVLTMEALFLGDLDSFSNRYADSRTKFQIPHRDHSPQVGKLLGAMKKWMVTRQETRGWRNEGILVFAPASNIPAAIVIQVLDALKREGSFEKVILAGGLI